MSEVGELTDLQIHLVYFHKRNKDGGLVAPVKELQDAALHKRFEIGDLEEELQKLRVMCQSLPGFPQDQREKLENELRAKWDGVRAR